MKIYLKWMLCLLLLPAWTACGAGGPSDDGGGTMPKGESEPAAITNRVDVPPAVRRNLGILFA